MKRQTASVVFACLLGFSLTTLAKDKCQICPKKHEEKKFRYLEMEERRYVKCVYANPEDYAKRNRSKYRYVYYRIQTGSPKRRISMDQSKGKWDGAGNTHYCTADKPEDCQFLFHSNQNKPREVKC